MNPNNEKNSTGCFGARAKAGSIWLRLGLVAMLAFGASCGDADPFGTGPGREALCADTCRFAFDGACDDGGSGSSYSECQYGSDCSDCGPRDPQEYNCCNDYRFFEDEMACMSGLKECP